MIFYIGWI